ncbi:TetR family transcriptional regulator [Hydrogenophaga sp.]|uniref:TetR family transcriptional regulator n=1 Tax=Hydrogenophaga sp. TaxID=1904254 RepID=UPI003F72C9E8
MTTWKGAVPGADTQFMAKRQAILREAASSFNRKGYHGTSLTDIAQTLGVSKAALYTYVKSKDELLAFCHEAAMDAADESLQRARAAGGTALKQFCGTMLNYLRVIMSKESCYVVLLEEHALTPEAIAQLLARRDRFEGELRGLVAAGIIDGSIAPCNPKMAVFSALGAINWVQKWYVAGGGWTGDQVAVSLMELLERMLSSSPASALSVDPSLLPPLAQPAPGA